MADPTNSPPSIAPEALQAIAAPRAPDAPRRCFICLTDEEPSDPPSSWVDPCPCTLEAHQDCMLSWVTDCERSQKPLVCPVCKSAIKMEGPWDPIVALAEAVQRRFTRASPFVLFTGVSLGVQFSSQMYGALALWAFAGREALMEFMLGPDMIIDGRSTRGLKFARVGNAAILMNIAPTLLLSQLLPGLGNKILVPTASLYGIYHVMHDDNFVSWPPSPQLAIAVFPYIRSLYYNMWREFVFPYEMNFNRQILGLPLAEPPRRNNNGDDDADQRRIAQRNGEGGLVGLLQGVLDALDPDDEENRNANGQGDGNVGEGDQDEVVVDVEVIVDGDEVNNIAPADLPNGVGPQPGAGHRGAEAEAPPAAPQPQQDQQPQNNHEAPQAPPRRFDLGTLLSNFSNALVSSLILPGISFAMGEALRLALPSSWTTASPRFAWRQRPGLLQQQWGRSLVGGCIYVVMKDAIRFYAKYRKVSAMGSRRVKNVDRPRRGRNNR